MVESNEGEVKAIALLHDLLEDCEEWDFNKLTGSLEMKIL